MWTGASGVRVFHAAIASALVGCPLNAGHRHTTWKFLGGFVGWNSMATGLPQNGHGMGFVSGMPPLLPATPTGSQSVQGRGSSDPETRLADQKPRGRWCEPTSTMLPRRRVTHHVQITVELGRVHIWGQLAVGGDVVQLLLGQVRERVAFPFVLALRRGPM